MAQLGTAALSNGAMLLVEPQTRRQLPMNLDGNSLLAGFAVSTVGFGFFMYGKKQGRAPQIAFGLISMIFPYFVGAPLVMLGIFAALSALLYLALRLGW